MGREKNEIYGEYGVIDSDDFVYYYIEGSRGFWLGYQNGLYEEERMNEVKNCLDEESVDEILKVIRILDEMTGHEVYEEFYNRLYAQNHTEKVQDIVESAELIRGNIEENCLLKETLNDLW
eukprot:CAMPEP_0170540992 /NCGR_PEP_ID=MMETSP0211-20121228/860_1 /TAXON_ID=311385 /ORGANISM="Pseudokeronopsis sp., Strain OXSARD2" /LENGTH=120 /DNA_ID=CAMNT_0010843569 /DNA_START=170 /DNA_END=530 /DNA_ORIENTATION=-